MAAHVRAGSHVALSGGSTPRAAYERLAGFELDWSSATLWFGDERCVAPDDERSNFLMVRSALLDRLPPPGPRVERIEAERGPEEGAASYQRLLRDAFGTDTPELDLVLLGIGPDGHCASLFPGGPELTERARLVAGVKRAGLAPWVPRVTLTLPAIDAGRAVVFAAAGADKAQAVARAVAGDPGLPAGLVAPASGDLTFLLDAEAAAQLPAEVTR
jgi:6-phosphogluconolactonase